MKTKKSIWIVTAILALLTTGMVYVYLGQVKAASQEDKLKMSEVVVAVNTIPAHVKVTEEMLELKKIPAEAVQTTAFTNISDAVGGTTTTELIAGEQVVTDRIVTDIGDSALSYRIPENMRAITVATTEFDSVGGYIVVGDKLDMLISYTPAGGEAVVNSQLQNIEVLEKGAYKASSDETQTGVPSSLTLLVTPEQAEVISYATLTGTIYFTLRNPVDVIQ